MISEKNSVEKILSQWIEKVVIGLNLCPFAKPSWDKKQYKIHVISGRDFKSNFDETLDLLNSFQEANPKDLKTIFIVYPDAKDNFLKFYNFSALVEEAISEVGLEEEVQAVTFHPEFRFEGEKKNARGNFVNRSPYPMIHLLRFKDVYDVIDKMGEDIGKKVAKDNKDMLISLSEEKFNKQVLRYVEGHWSGAKRFKE